MNENTQNTAIATQTSSEPLGIVDRMSVKYGLKKEKFYNALVRVIFKSDEASNISQEEVAAFLVVCEQYNLNPFLREIYPAVSRKQGLLPVLGVDGWLKQMHASPSFDGVEVSFAENRITVTRESEGKNGFGRPYTATAPEYCQVKIYLKGKSHPVVIQEFLDETFRPTDQWVSKPCRMLRHKALIQGIRVAFGMSGVYDAEEANSIIDAEARELTALNRNEPVAPPSVADRIPQAKSPRQFKSEEQRNQYVATIIQRCKDRGVISQASEFFAERLSEDDLEYALKEVEKAFHEEVIDATGGTISQVASPLATVSHEDVVDVVAVKSSAACTKPLEISEEDLPF